MEAIRLVKEDGFSINKACSALNEVKVNLVPRMTLSDRLKKDNPTTKPPLGRPQELSEAVELALVKCLEMCAEFQYPMKRRDFQDLVQSYCVEHSIKTR